MLGKKGVQEKNDSWCTVLVNDSKTEVQVRHLGRGKFIVVSDESEGSLIGKELDASEIFHC